MRATCLLSLALVAAVPLTSASEVVLRRVTSGTSTNLLRNGSFEEVEASRFARWSAAPGGYRVATAEGRTNTTALACDATVSGGYRGASQTLVLNQASPTPIVIRGWSRAEDVSGASDSDYSLYADLSYTDGTPLWGQTGNFQVGTHDWELQEFTIFPEKPVRTLTLHCLFRGGHTGRVWFDDVRVEQLATDGATVLFEGVPMEQLPASPPPVSGAKFAAAEDGLRLGLAGQRVVSLTVDGRELTAPVIGGFLARDVAANSDIHLFQDGVCAELGLALDAQVSAQSNHLVIAGRLRDTTQRDRAVTLFFALPFDGAGWQWQTDLREARAIGGRGEFAQLTSVKCGATGSTSVYPLAAVTDDRTGVALALDMGMPSVCRFVYHAGTRQLFVACDFGLVPETERFPGAADFRFVLFRFEPRWGFRAAWAKFQEVFPEYYAVRSRTQGIWMPFTDISTVQGWGDFGFRYQEGAPNVTFDDQHGILSFRYVEPMTWWMPMAPALPRTLAEALRVRDEYARGQAGNNQRMALVSKTTAMWDASGQPALLFRNEPWANGAVWSLNPNPALPASPNAATVLWTDALRSQFSANTAPAGLDGMYLDSLEGYVTAEVNLRRDHFRWTSVPLTFTTGTRQPALFKGLAVYELTRWISEDIHRLGRLLFANGVPYRFGYLCPWLDILGTETDWLSGGNYQPVSHAQMAYWRTLSGAKPYLLLMNTDYDRFGPHVEKYFQRALFYGMYPSLFSHNASENPYWRNPTWYNRDRPLFRKYLPVIRRVAEAGWQPVTEAACDNPAIWAERFGPDTNGVRYFTLFNDSAAVQTGVLTEQATAPGRTGGAVATELLSGTVLARAGDGWKVELAPQGALAIQIERGPRFVNAAPVSGPALQLTIETPPRLTQVLETSPDLHGWKAIATNTPAVSTFVVALAQSYLPGARFYRLRY